MLGLEGSELETEVEGGGEDDVGLLMNEGTRKAEDRDRISKSFIPCSGIQNQDDIDTANRFFIILLNHIRNIHLSTNK